MTGALQIELNQAELNRVLDRYIEVTRKAPAEALIRQGRNLAFYLLAELRALTPEKGSLRAQGLLLLRLGGGVRVRPSVLKAVSTKYRARVDLATRRTVLGRGKRGAATLRSGGKRLNLQAAAVRAELSVRERSRGFLRQSARFTRSLVRIGDETRSESRFRQLLGLGELKQEGPSGASLTLSWGRLGPYSREAAAGLSTGRGAIARQIALRKTADDISGYLARRLSAGNIRGGAL